MNIKKIAQPICIIAFALYISYIPTYAGQNEDFTIRNCLAGSTMVTADALANADENAIKFLKKQEQEKLRKKQKEKEEAKKRKALEKKKKKQEKEKIKYYHIYKDRHKYEAPADIQDHVRILCKEYGIEWANKLILCQMYHESRYQPYCVSSTDDYGYMQINRQNFEWISNKLGISNITEPYQNIRAGVYLMSKYIHKYNDTQTALVCYNMGEAALQRGIYSSKYSRSILYLLQYNLYED